MVTVMQQKPISQSNVGDITVAIRQTLKLKRRLGLSKIFETQCYLRWGGAPNARFGGGSQWMENRRSLAATCELPPEASGWLLQKESPGPGGPCPSSVPQIALQQARETLKDFDEHLMAADHFVATEMEMCPKDKSLLCFVRSPGLYPVWSTAGSVLATQVRLSCPLSQTPPPKTFSTAANGPTFSRCCSPSSSPTTFTKCWASSSRLFRERIHTGAGSPRPAGAVLSWATQGTCEAPATAKTSMDTTSS